MKMVDALVVLVTCPPDAAEALASDLVSDSVAACVNIIPSVTSVYRWDGKVVRDSEALLVIKTTAPVWPRLESKIKEAHSYDVPEMICIRLEGGHEPYLDWLRKSVTQKA